MAPAGSECQALASRGPPASLAQATGRKHGVDAWREVPLCCARPAGDRGPGLREGREASM
eukprot:8676580-Lingulodinium_polyedra.AAC.1